MSSSRETPRPILGGLGRFAHFGTALGDAALRDPAAPDRARDALTRLGLDDGLFMTPDFTNVLLEAVGADIEPLGAPGVDPVRLWRTTAPCDGVLLDREGWGVMITNGDCAVGVLADPETGALVVMHLGLMCLWRSSGGPTVLERAVERLAQRRSERARLKFFAGGAIGPCCHGYSHHSEAEARRARALIDAFGEDVVSGRVELGPRRGAFAYNHRLMALRLAAKLGVERLEEDARCTACAGLEALDAPGYGEYFSHTRDHLNGRERNLAIVAMG